MPKKTLVEAEIVSSIRVGRRSALRLAAAAAGAAFGLGLEGCHHARTSGCTDSDSSDPRGAGRCTGLDGGARPDGGATPDGYLTPDGYVTPDAYRSPDAYRPPDAYSAPDAWHSCSDSDPTDPGGSGTSCNHW